MGGRTSHGFRYVGGPVIDIQLTEREIRVLEAIVRNYIVSALPTGSRYISKLDGFDLSAATIRNVMGDLEEKGLIAQPHASAGRTPTDNGYRYYVDRLMRLTGLPEKLQRQIREELAGAQSSDLHVLMEVTSRVLSRATDQLGIILSPELCSGVFRHVDMYEIEDARYIMTLTIGSGFVKTVVVELATDITQERLEAACHIINERFAGMTLDEMSDAGNSAFGDVEPYDLGVIRLFVPSIKKMIEQSKVDEVFTEGETNILLKPEFFDKEQAGAVIEMFERRSLLIHLLGPRDGTGGLNHAVVSIGGEIESGKFDSFSVVKTMYQVGNMTGCLGVIGPKRMPYPFLVSAVEYTSRVLGELYAQ